VATRKSGDRGKSSGGSGEVMSCTRIAKSADCNSRCARCCICREMSSACVSSQTGDVDQANQTARQRHLGREGIARGAGDGGDDRALLAGQGVEQRALAGIGTTDQYEARLVRKLLESPALPAATSLIALRRCRCVRQSAVTREN